MVCDYLEWSSFEEVVEMFDSPDNSKLFQLGSTIILDCSSDGSASIADHLFAMDLLSFLGVFPSDREILCKDGSQTISACICVQLEGSFQ